MGRVGSIPLVFSPGMQFTRVLPYVRRPFPADPEIFQGVCTELLLLLSGDGETCLLMAAFEGNPETVMQVKTLLEGAEAAQVLAELLLLRRRDGESCLAVSAHKRNIEALRELLEAARACDAGVTVRALETTSEQRLLEIAASPSQSALTGSHAACLAFLRCCVPFMHKTSML
jgi:hypothetical protein